MLADKQNKDHWFQSLQWVKNFLRRRIPWFHHSFNNYIIRDPLFELQKDSITNQSKTQCLTTNIYSHAHEPVADCGLAEKLRFRIWVSEFGFRQISSLLSVSYPPWYCALSMTPWSPHDEWQEFARADENAQCLLRPSSRFVDYGFCPP